MINEILNIITQKQQNKMIDLLIEVRKNMITQDNRSTGNPYFIVIEGDKPDVLHPNSQIFLTQKGADKYIEENGHNLHKPWVYIKSGNNSPEWRMVRHLFGGGD